MVGDVRTCQIMTPNASIGIGFMPLGLAQFVVNGIETDRIIGWHHAKEDHDPSYISSCYVAIGLTSTMRVDISVQTSTTVDACPLALQAAAMVERRLPVVG
jgi:hypothetical protein